MGVAPETDRCLVELGTLLGERFSTSRSVLEQHSTDESSLPPALPDGVAFPSSTDEVARVLSICNRLRVPVVPFGAGTSLEGHVLPTSGGVSIDLAGMDQILAVRVADLDVTIQAGVTRKTLQDRLARDGLFFPVDPGADATLGGMAATGASGTTTVRYGSMRENTLAMKVALADGRVLDTASRARKSSAGYDLTRLFIGSEGTLGVIAELTLRVRGIPEVISAATCHFPSIEDAIGTVISTLQMGIPVARIEFLDESAVRASNSFSDLSLPAAPMLLLEFHGGPNEVEEQMRNFSALASSRRALAMDTAEDNTERSRLWRARHDSFYASLALRPGAKAVTTDVCVPISRLAECIVDTKRDIEQLRLTTTIVGHVGDGNFHVVMLVDPDDADEVDRGTEMNHRLVRRAIALDGTCTGEHGIGLRKVPFLPLEAPDGVDVMRTIKRALDPNGIMNPGKILATEGR